MYTHIEVMLIYEQQTLFWGLRANGQKFVRRYIKSKEHSLIDQKKQKNMANDINMYICWATVDNGFFKALIFFSVLLERGRSGQGFCSNGVSVLL